MRRGVLSYAITPPSSLHHLSISQTVKQDKHKTPRQDNIRVAPHYICISQHLFIRWMNEKRHALVCKIIPLSVVNFPSPPRRGRQKLNTPTRQRRAMNGSCMVLYKLLKTHAKHTHTRACLSLSLSLF